MEISGRTAPTAAAARDPAISRSPASATAGCRRPGSEEGLVLFVTLGYSPFEDVAIMPVQSTFGANYTGLFPAREKDKTVFFATYGGFSSDYADQQAAAGDAKSDYEMVLEVGHRFQVTPSTYIQPDMQYIVQPGGTGDIDNALVLGFQFGASF